MPEEKFQQSDRQPDQQTGQPNPDRGFPEEGGKVSPLKTLKADVSQYLKEGISLADIAKSARAFPFQKTSQLSKPILINGLAFLAILGLIIGGWLLFRQKPEEKTVVSAPSPLIFSDKQQIITIKSTDRFELIRLAKNALLQSAIPLNTLWHFPILFEGPVDKKFIEIRDFLEILRIKPPINFSQALEGPFMLGVFYFHRNSPFLIFKMRSYELGFSGALEWEKKMTNDLKEILLIENSEKSAQKFQDKMIKNRDVRILYDTEGKPILLYSFVKKELLVITADLESFEEIVRRSLVSSP